MPHSPKLSGRQVDGARLDLGGGALLPAGHHLPAAPGAACRVSEGGYDVAAISLLPASLAQLPSPPFRCLSPGMAPPLNPTPTLPGCRPAGEERPAAGDLAHAV